MKVKEVIAAIEAYHPPINAPITVDLLNIGDPEMEVTGIASLLQPTPDALRSAAEAGCNFVMCHEPIWFNGMNDTDMVADDPVYLAKKALIESLGVAVYRNHDHMHAHEPDAIFEGVLTLLGWAPYATRLEIPCGSRTVRQYEIRLPEPTTARAVAAHLRSTIGLERIRLIGDPETPVQIIRKIAHMDFLTQETDLRAIREADLVIPGEVLDFSALSYAREACQLGVPKAILNIGHYNLERLGMRWAPTWLRQLFPETKVVWIDSGDPYSYL